MTGGKERKEGIILSSLPTDADEAEAITDLKKLVDHRGLHVVLAHVHACLLCPARSEERIIHFACCLPSSRLDTASIRSSLLLPPGFLEWQLQRVLKINASSKSLFEQLCEFKKFVIPVLRPRTMLFSVPQQARAAFNRPPFLGLSLYVVLVLTWWVFTPSALRLAIELLHA